MLLAIEELWGVILADYTLIDADEAGAPAASLDDEGGGGVRSRSSNRQKICSKMEHVLYGRNRLCLKNIKLWSWYSANIFMSL